ncbi:PAS domain S-box protein [Candidatus Woesearchaeota archaeon]|nr:PAS domain S-box protein [Candidatus Woesearchaeota archaeon]
MQAKDKKKIPPTTDALLNMLEDLEEANKKIKHSEKRYRKLFEKAGIPIVLYSRDGELLVVNKEFLDMTGYSAKDITNREKLYRSAFPSKLVKDRMEESLSKVYSGKIVRNLVVPIKCKDGTTDIVVTTMTLIKKGSGNVMGEAYFMQDLSQIFELEDQIRYWAANGFIQIKEKGDTEDTYPRIEISGQKGQ